MPHNYTNHVAPSMTPKKELLYEVFVKLNTHVANPRCTKLNKVYVSLIKERLTVNFKQQVLENAMSYTAPTSNHDILKSVTSVFENVQDFDLVEEGELEASDLINVPGAIKLPTIPENSPLTIDDFSKKTIYVSFFEGLQSVFYCEKRLPHEAIMSPQ